MRLDTFLSYKLNGLGNHDQGSAMSHNDVMRKNRTDILRMLVTVFAGSVQSRLANEIKGQNGKGMDPGQFNKVINGDGRLAPVRQTSLVSYINRVVPNLITPIFEGDLEISEEDFIHKFNGTSVFTKMHRAGSAQNAPVADMPYKERLALLAGRYVGLFLCGDPADIVRSKSVVGTSMFEIVDSGAHQAVIHQLGYAFKAVIPRGTVCVRDSTIEISIDFLESRNPFGTFLASFPSTSEIEIILAIALDIKGRSRDVVARPFMLVRHDRTDFDQFYGDDTELFEAVKALFESHVKFNAERFEIVPDARIAAVNVAAVIQALNDIEPTSAADASAAEAEVAQPD